MDRLSIVLVLILLIANCAIADEPSSDRLLRVISYNVQFLPGPAAIANKRKEASYRAQTIGQKLTEYDIIGLNELFDDKPKELVLAEIKQAWGDQANILVSPKIRPDRFTGGLAIISRYPFLETNVHTYTQSSSPEKHGFMADGFAMKGILHARIALTEDHSSENSIDVFVTHLEAREPAIRPSQYAEFADFLGKHSAPTRPAILLGDFNTRGGQEERDDKQSAYNDMTGRFQAACEESALIDLWPAIGKGVGGTTDQESQDGGKRIDYIFLLSPNRNSAPKLKGTQVAVNRFLDDRVYSLSDHSAVEATIEWTQP